MDKFLSGYLDRIEKRYEKVRTEEYLNWIEEFTKEHLRFSDDDWLYKKEEISEQDYENVEILSSFYSYIADLASEQEIMGEEGDCDITYDFKMRGKYYRICTMHGQGAVTFLSSFGEKAPGKIFVKMDEPVTEKELKERELIQYIIINEDYIGKIDAAKFGVHIGHACTICAMEEKGTTEFDRWYKKGQLQKKIILTAPTKRLEELENDFYSVRDLGFTEVEKGTLLAVSLGIMTRYQAKAFTKGMKLWKD